MSLTFIPYNRSNVSDDNQLNHSSPYTPIIPPSYSSPYTPIRPPSSIQEPSATAAPLPLLHELNPSVNEPNTLHTQAVRPKNGPGSSALLHRFLSQPDNPKQEKKNVVHPLKPTTFFKSKARLDADPSSIEAFPTWASLEFDTEHHKRARAILTQRTLVWPEGHGCPRCVVKKRTCSVVEGLDLCASCCADRLLSLKCGVCVLPNGSPGIKISRHNTATVKDIPSKTSQQLQMSSESPDPLLSSALDELDSSVWYVNPSNSLDSEPKPLEQGDFSPASIAMEGMAHNDWPLHGLSGDDANISIVSSSDDENDTNASNLGTLQNLPHWAAKVKYKNSSRVFKILKKPTFEYPLGEGCERCIRMRRICVVRDGIVTCASCTASHQSGAQCGVGVPSQARPHKGLL